MKKFKKILLIFLIIIIITGGIVYLLLRSTRPQLKGEIVVSEELNESVLIKRNDYGIPLIEANSFPDVLFAIGFLHASDRLFQMELSRRNAFGQLSEIVGEIALAELQLGIGNCSLADLSSRKQYSYKKAFREKEFLKTIIGLKNRF